MVPFKIMLGFQTNHRNKNTYQIWVETQSFNNHWAKARLDFELGILNNSLKLQLLELLMTKCIFKSALHLSVC